MDSLLKGSWKISMSFEMQCLCTLSYSTIGRCLTQSSFCLFIVDNFWRCLSFGGNNCWGVSATGSYRKNCCMKHEYKCITVNFVILNALLLIILIGWVIMMISFQLFLLVISFLVGAEISNVSSEISTQVWMIYLLELITSYWLLVFLLENGFASLWTLKSWYPYLDSASILIYAFLVKWIFLLFYYIYNLQFMLPLSEYIFQ